VNLKQRTSSESDPCDDAVSIKGSRMFSAMLENLAVGASPESIMEDYHIDADDVQAALQYASELAGGQVTTLRMEAE